MGQQHWTQPIIAMFTLRRGSYHGAGEAKPAVPYGFKGQDQVVPDNNNMSEASPSEALEGHPISTEEAYSRLVKFLQIIETKHDTECKEAQAKLEMERKEAQAKLDTERKEAQAKLDTERKEAQAKIDLAQHKMDQIQYEAQIQGKNSLEAINNLILGLRIPGRASSYLGRGTMGDSRVSGTGQSPLRVFRTELGGVFFGVRIGGSLIYESNLVEDEDPVLPLIRALANFIGSLLASTDSEVVSSDPITCDSADTGSPFLPALPSPHH